MDDTERQKLLRLKNSQAYKALLEANNSNLSLTANGCMYKRVAGFLPLIMQALYDDRVKYKKLMLEAKKELASLNDSSGLS